MSVNSIIFGSSKRNEGERKRGTEGRKEEREGEMHVPFRLMIRITYKLCTIAWNNLCRSVQSRTVIKSFHRPCI